MISLIVISLITAALAPVITKKLTSGTITVGSFGGGGGGGENITCPAGLYIDMDTKTCEVCPAGFECDGANKIPCPAGTFSLNRQSECTPCEDGYYSLDGATQCLENTAQNCAEKSKVDNACLSCDGEDILVDGNCILSVPIYTFLNSGGSNITETATELTKDENYWYIKIKSTGTLTFSSMPTNLIDVFVVGGGRGGRKATSGCASTDPGGGGNYNILNNVFVSNDTNYPITIGAGTSAGTCASEASNGGTSSAFGIFAKGGITKGNHAICAFNEASCDLKYGETGNSTNQITNTGNGGNNGARGMSGIVILRGKTNLNNLLVDYLPTYRLFDSSDSDITNKYTNLSITNDYWYLRVTSSGKLKFNSIVNDKIDVFLVGGGRGGRKATSGCASTDPGGGGNYNILNNVFVSNDTNYPITIGAGTSAGTCAREASNGGTSSAFDGSAAGGTGTTTSHTICLFAGTSSYDCMLTYGNYGTNDNQFQNSGNGGTKANGGMNGVVIIRGTL